MHKLNELITRLRISTQICIFMNIIDGTLVKNIKSIIHLTFYIFFYYICFRTFKFTGNGLKSAVINYICVTCLIFLSIFVPL